VHGGKHDVVSVCFPAFHCPSSNNGFVFQHSDTIPLSLFLHPAFFVLLISLSPKTLSLAFNSTVQKSHIILLGSPAFLFPILHSHHLNPPPRTHHPKTTHSRHSLLNMRLTSLLIPSFLIALTLLIINNTPANILIEFISPFESLCIILRIIWGMLHTPMIQGPMFPATLRQVYTTQGPRARGPWSFYEVPIAWNLKNLW
jgi:hypothetical protein